MRSLFLCLFILATQSYVSGQSCPIPPIPNPSGTSASFQELKVGGGIGFPSDMTCSTLLQGNPTSRKFAASAFFLPDFTDAGIQASLPAEFVNMRTAVIVNNPDPNNSVTVTIEYHDYLGSSPGQNTVVIAPSGTYTEQACPLAGTWGSARVTVVGSGTIVGSTVHHGPDLGVNFGDPFPVAIAPQIEALGVTCAQQLQANQGKSNVWFGPFPIADSYPEEVLNGVIPGFVIRNTSVSDIDATVHVLELKQGQPAVINSSVQTIAKNGTYFSTQIWNDAIQEYNSGSVDDRFIFVVVNTQYSNLPGPGTPGFTDPPSVVGEAFMADTYGDFMESGAALRMSSMMMSHDRTDTLYNPDFTFTPADPINNLESVVTVMGIQNITNKNRGNLTVEYRDRDGVVVGVDTINLTPRRSVLIGPGLPDSPNYPTGNVDSGSVRAFACQKGIIGWTMRHSVIRPQELIRETWGEALEGATGSEPGGGEIYSLPNDDEIYAELDIDPNVESVLVLRRVASLQRVTDLNPEFPSYLQYANLDTANTGEHFLRIFRLNGADVTDYAPSQGSQQPFPGLESGNTQFTYLDQYYGSSGAQTVSAYVDCLDLTSRIRGISVLGGHVDTWQLDFENPCP